MSTDGESGIISSCLEQVKSRNALLIAIVSDGHFYKDLFDSNQVKTLLSENNTINLYIKFPSREYTQFAELYNLGTPPFISLIASNGITVEAVRGEIPQEYFIKLFKFALSNIAKGAEENTVYYPLNELVNLPVPEVKTVPKVIKIVKQDLKHNPTPGITVKELEPKSPEAVVINRQAIIGNCRIKFTLSNGSNISNAFEPTTTLVELKNFLRDRIPGLINVTIIRPHPREEFQPNQDTLTLQELDIRTGSALIVHSGTSEVAKSSIQSVFTAIFSFFAAIWFYFFPARKTQISTQTNTPANMAYNPTQSRQNAKSNSTTRGVGRRGNTFRLSDLRDKDDESNTYNGNSTQQQ